MKPLILLAPPALAVAMRNYYFFRELSNLLGIPFNKEAFRQAIFDAASKVFGDRLVYSESMAATYVFHVLPYDNAPKAIVWEIHLTKDHEEATNFFSLLTYSTWLNK